MHRPTISDPAFPNPFSLSNHQAKLCSGGVLSAVRIVVVGRASQSSRVRIKSRDVSPDRKRTRAMP